MALPLMMLKLKGVASDAVEKMKSGMASVVTNAPEELKAASYLAMAFQNLVLVGEDRADVRSESGRGACERFLFVLAMASEQLDCQAADRSYRAEFTMKYRLMYPDTKRRYRVDMFEAVFDGRDSFDINGTRFRLSNSTLDLGIAVVLTWGELGGLLKSWSSGAGSRMLAALRAALVDFDSNWARFERAYISELIAIESQARSVLVDAIHMESRLVNFEHEFGEAAGVTSRARQSLAKSLAELNATANSRRKGRGDLGFEVLERCSAVLASSEMEHSAARSVATRAVAAFAALRAYLQRVSRCLERVDPCLCNNAVLVDRLVDWEQSWEVASAYLEGPMSEALTSTVARIMGIKNRDFVFAGMCDDRDAELFLVLPRIVLLTYLSKPEDHSALFKSMLPDAFQADGEPGPELQELLDECGAVRAHVPSSVLWRRCVHGAAEPCDVLTPAALAGLQGFTRELERWSMALQRRRPDDWNALAVVILQAVDDGLTNQIRISSV